MTVGRATAVYWPGVENIAVSLAELADVSTDWPGLTQGWHSPLTVLIASDQSTFDSLTRGIIPEWGAGVAYPFRNTIVLKLNGDPRRVLTHELAHLALHSRVRRTPLWFSEGYAVRAAGEWGRLSGLRVNLALALGRVPGFATLDRDLRGGATTAGSAYALAATAVLLLERMGRERGLAPLFERWNAVGGLDQALRETHLVTLDQFEEAWRKDTRTRYGWLAYLSSFTVFWMIVGGLVSVLWYSRIKRDRLRREQLDSGWDVPSQEWRGDG